MSLFNQRTNACMDVPSFNPDALVANNIGSILAQSWAGWPILARISNIAPTLAQYWPIWPILYLYWDTYIVPILAMPYCANIELQWPILYILRQYCPILHL